MSAPKRREINLLLQRRFEDTPLGRFLNWALSAGRVIVILTELIVIAAFLSRFWLDRTLTDLNEENTALKAQVDAFSSFETEFRQTQERISLYKTLSSSQDKFSLPIREIASLVPADIALTNLSFSEESGSAEIKGRALSEGGLAGFIKALEKSSVIKEIKITDLSLETREQQLITFSLTGKLKEENASN